jgi:tripartite-type tricarboxylate transporter receptor subunit TctC
MYRYATLLALFCGLVLASTARAQPADYPSKPIRMIVISSAGGTTDILARMVGRALTADLGQAIVLDNRPGGGGAIAAEITARARPDGYTLLLANTTHTVLPSLHPKLPYDPVKDFAAVSLVTLTHSLLTVNPALPVKNVRELVELARAQPGKLNYASGATGSSAHIGAELLKVMAGIDILRVPYKGTAENVIALISGESQIGFVTLPAALPHVSAGRLRAIAIGGPARWSRLPELPTVAESLPGFDISTWQGVLAPARTPPAIVMRLNAALVRMARNSEAVDQAARLGVELVGSSPQELVAHIQGQIEKFGKVVKATGMRAD